MRRTPAAHRLATKRARRERAYRRALYRFPVRFHLGARMEPWQMDLALAAWRPGLISIPKEDA